MTSLTEVRYLTDRDRPAWGEMRARLWPDGEPDELAHEAQTARLDDPAAVTFLAYDVGGPIGFIELAVRNYAEGAVGPAAYVEGIFVETTYRRRGVATALLAAAERWARDKGLAHLGSDASLDNEVSHAWHRAAGFDELERLVVFGKPLG